MTWLAAGLELSRAELDRFLNTLPVCYGFAVAIHSEICHSALVCLPLDTLHHFLIAAFYFCALVVPTSCNFVKLSFISAFLKASQQPHAHSRSPFHVFTNLHGHFYLIYALISTSKIFPGRGHRDTPTLSSLFPLRYPHTHPHPQSKTLFLIRGWPITCPLINRPCKQCWMLARGRGQSGH